MVISHNQELRLLQDCLVREAPCTSSSDFEIPVTPQTPRPLLVPLFLKHSAFGWTDIEVKNRVGLIEQAHTRYHAGTAKLCISLKVLAITFAGSFQPLISPLSLIHSESKINVSNEGAITSRVHRAWLGGGMWWGHVAKRGPLNEQGPVQSPG